MSANPPPLPCHSLRLFWQSSRALWWRDTIRFLRQRNRIISAFVTPLVFWLLLGSGFTGAFHLPGSSLETDSYLHYFFPGTVVLILLFTAIYSTVSVIEDRREGFLQGVLVSPAPPASIALGKFLGGTTLAALQGIVFCALAPLAGIPVGLDQIFPLLLSLLLCSFAMTGLGFLIAWPMDSTAGFHALMNVILMPLWMLSGALFPVSSSGGWTWWAALANPVSYCVHSIRCALSPAPWASPANGGPSLATSLFVSALFGATLFAIGTWMVVRRKGPLV